MQSSAPLPLTAWRTAGCCKDPNSKSICIYMYPKSKCEIKLGFTTQKFNVRRYININ